MNYVILVFKNKDETFYQKKKNLSAIERTQKQFRIKKIIFTKVIILMTYIFEKTGKKEDNYKD